MLRFAAFSTLNLNSQNGMNEYAVAQFIQLYSLLYNCGCGFELSLNKYAAAADGKVITIVVGWALSHV